MNSPNNSPSNWKWRWARRILLGVAFLITLVAAVHTVENWRGKRVWERCERELKSKGEVLDWAAYLPAPVPDDQNVYRAPKMESWFVRARHTEPARKGDGPFAIDAPMPDPVYPKDRTPVVLALIRVDTGSGPAIDQSDSIIQLEDVDIQRKALEVVRAASKSITAKASGGWLTKEWPLTIKPINVVLQTERVPSTEEVRRAFLPSVTAPFFSAFQLVASGSNEFRIQLGNQSVYLAEDYLRWTDLGTNDLRMIKSALERPGAYIHGEYDMPFIMSIPNFVTIRTVAQRVSERAGCHLLLGNPNDALEDLTVMHNLSRLLEAEPTTLVSAMIDVAVTGLYCSMIQEGLRLEAWREADLVELQGQLGEIRLISKVHHALRVERAGMSRTFEMSNPGRLFGLINQGASSPSDKLQESLGLVLFPRGWMHQNRAALVLLQQEILECFDPTNQHVANPQELNGMAGRVESKLRQYNPYTILARVAVPNVTRASMVGARTQAMAQWTLGACALERYRKKNGAYPDQLASLVPEYLDTVPQDPMTAKPLIYRRINESYVLYSVGWNQQDDGGKSSDKPEELDWTWQ